ncbi:MAG: hypothetical protein JKY61_06840 [Planctomycetes bacterium]|nr:hypothetical protein [Planctomycetota bacterium]
MWPYVALCGPRWTQLLTRKTLAVFFALFVVGTSFGQVRFVDPASPGPIHDGLSWGTAFSSLSDALDQANAYNLGPNPKLLLAQGTYKPSTTSPLNVMPGGSVGQPWHHTFFVKVPCEIYGGYVGVAGGAGASTTPGEPDGSPYLTVLSGEIGASGPVDNCAHVLYVGDPNDQFAWRYSKLLLRDLRIVDGHARRELAQVPWEHENGGGIYSHGAVVEFEAHVFVQDCFADNDGGGIYILDDPSFTHVLNSGGFRSALSRIEGNWAGRYGGGLYHGSAPFRLWGSDSLVVDSATAIFNTVFRKNQAMKGGGIYVIGGFRRDGEDIIFQKPGFLVSNSLFFENSALDAGGGAFIADDVSGAFLPDDYDYALHWVNNTFARNSATLTGGGMELAINPNVVISNSILHWNTAGPSSEACDLYYPDNTFSLPPTGLRILNCNIGGGCNSIKWWTNVQGVIGDDPQFVDMLAGNFQLKWSSPCLDVGLDSQLPFDDMDVDEDDNTVPGEILSLDLKRFTPFGAMENWREIVYLTGPNSAVYGTITGSDAGGDRPGAIVDLGCYEFFNIGQASGF